MPGDEETRGFRGVVVVSDGPRWKVNQTVIENPTIAHGPDGPVGPN